jgi:hypothetical protein
LVNNHLSVSGFYGGPFLSSEIDAPPTVNGYLKNPGNAPIFAVFWTWFFRPDGVGWGVTYSHAVSTGWNLTSKMLGEFDRKLDDGNAWTGSVRRGFGGDSRCADLTTGVWPDNAPSVNCAAVMLF